MCMAEGCNNKVYAKGYCGKHYQQLKKHGKILERTKYDPNEIVIEKGHAKLVLYNKKGEEVAITIIDLEDVHRVCKYRWCLDNDGYARATIGGKKIYLHRFILDAPMEFIIDHINHIGLDNRKSNLRLCTNKENQRNKSIMSNNTSGVVGVYFDKKSNKWRPNIMVDRKQLYLGRYDDYKFACLVRRVAEVLYFGEFAPKKYNYLDLPLW